jgi:hypothetical protein
MVITGATAIQVGRSVPGGIAVIGFTRSHEGARSHEERHCLFFPVLSAFGAPNVHPEPGSRRTTNTTESVSSFLRAFVLLRGFV